MRDRTVYRLTMTFRATLLERAYQLAENGSCPSLSAIKAALSAEGFTQIEIQMQLNASTVSKALSEKCRKSYTAPPDDDDAAPS